MRLANVQKGDGLKPRLIFGVMRAMSGFRAPDVAGEPHQHHTG